MAYFITTEKMSVGYDGHPLIENIDIALEKGEILTLIGPNGAGKSTILKSIAGQLKLIDGRVIIDGKDKENISRDEMARTMAVVWTDRIMTELMTCEEVVTTGRYPYTGRFGIPDKADREAVREAMELTHVTEIGDAYFDKLSDGQKQRVMLARAICQEPDIIILDEPTSYLDIRYKLEFLSCLQELKRKKDLTVIMSLHELELAGKISDKILCIKDGYVDRCGSPEEIFTKGYIGELFGISEENFLWYL
ncbi:MAG: ABC transporter ATP-binding protein [Lachnospiraceae bacterium]|nr:ABC transporter ATP-binding protein [Lachnospiraceae bacterium]